MKKDLTVDHGIVYLFHLQIAHVIIYMIFLLREEADKAAANPDDPESSKNAAYFEGMEWAATCER